MSSYFCFTVWVSVNQVKRERATLRDPYRILHVHVVVHFSTWENTIDLYFFYRKSKKNMYTILKLEAVRILFKNPNQWYFMTQTWIIIYPIHFLSRTSMPFRHIKTLSSIQYDRSICNMSAITKKNLVQRWRWGELCPF